MIVIWRDRFWVRKLGHRCRVTLLPLASQSAGATREDQEEEKGRVA